MTDTTTALTQADLDKAVRAAVDAAEEGLRSKNTELMDELKKPQRELRASKDITPDAHQAEIDRADKAEAALAEATKLAKAATADRDKALKSLESEQGAARSYALEAEIAGAIASGNVVPELVPAFKAMVQQQAKADLVDGKYSVTIGDKAAKDYIIGFLDSDQGKAFRAAPLNGGGGAPGGGGKSNAKSMTREAYDAAIVSDPAGTNKFLREGGTIENPA
jgi:hypothetical protein